MLKGKGADVACQRPCRRGPDLMNDRSLGDKRGARFAPSCHQKAFVSRQSPDARRFRQRRAQFLLLFL